MSALRVVEATGSLGDPVLARLEGMLADLAALVSDAEPVVDAVRDRITALERLRAATAAAQAGEVVRFARSQVAAQQDAGVDPRTIGWEGSPRGWSLTVGDGKWGLTCGNALSVVGRRGRRTRILSAVRPQ